MGKISKYSNLYDKDGKLIRSVDSISGRLDDYAIEELENLVDELAIDGKKLTNFRSKCIFTSNIKSRTVRVILEVGHSSVRSHKKTLKIKHYQS